MHISVRSPGYREVSAAKFPLLCSKAVMLIQWIFNMVDDTFSFLNLCCRQNAAVLHMHG